MVLWQRGKSRRRSLTIATDGKDRNGYGRESPGDGYYFPFFWLDLTIWPVE